MSEKSLDDLQAKWRELSARDTELAEEADYLESKIARGVKSNESARAAALHLLGESDGPPAEVVSVDEQLAAVKKDQAAVSEALRILSGRIFALEAHPDQ